MYKLPENHVLILRACNADMTSYNGFVWPSEGFVEVLDWNAKPKCGGGLHGWLWGEGDGKAHGDAVDPWNPESKWLCVEVEESSLVDLNGKVKFPRGNVVFCGSQFDATQFIAKHGKGKAIIGATSISGNGEVSVSGYRGTSNSGARGTSISGDYGTSISGYRGTSISGYRGTSNSGDDGTSISGDYGTSISGYRGTSTSGIAGTSISEVGGTSTSGYHGTILIKYWDKKSERYRILPGYIGEDGLKPNTPYVIEMVDGVAKFKEKVET